MNRLWARFTAPQPLARLELIRILVPLCVLGFMSSRILHADDWLSSAGFSVPDLHGDWRQQLYIPPLAPGFAWLLCAVMVVSGLALSLGAYTRAAAGTFALTLIYVALADRLAAFTVSKLGAVLVTSLFFTPCGARWSVDAWRRRRKNPALPVPGKVAFGAVRWFQLLLVVFYLASGIAKGRGDWMGDKAVIWSHLHDSYQTIFAYWVGKLSPTWSWRVFQAVTLAYELGAPLLFAVDAVRPFALVWGLAMHFMIGVMFGPVIYFSLLMMSVLAACFLPAPWIERALDQIVGRITRPRSRPRARTPAA